LLEAGARAPRFQLDAIGGSKQALQVGPVALAAAELFEERLGLDRRRR
jgi:hypothetical protein